MTDKVYNPYLKQDEDNLPLEFSSELNTNIGEYSIEDIFNLLDINIEEDSDYEKVIQEINDKVNTYISFFGKANNKDVVEFFKNVRISLLGELQGNKSEAELLLIKTNKTLDAEKTDTTNKELYNSNSGAGNPINRKTISKLLNIDSRFRNNYNTTLSTNYNITLPYEIRLYRYQNKD